MVIAANCRQRRKARSHTRVYTRPPARVSKIALTAVARYHIRHLVDLASPLFLFHPIADRSVLLRARAHTHTHVHSYALTPDHPLFPRLSLATKEVSVVANVVSQLRHMSRRAFDAINSIYFMILEKIGGAKIERVLRKGLAKLERILQ